MTTQSTASLTDTSRLKQVRRSASQWTAIIADYQSSGLTQRKFCTQRGVTCSSLAYWMVKLKQRSTVPSASSDSIPLFVDVTPSATTSPSAQDWDVELEFANGMVLRLRQY